MKKIIVGVIFLAVISTVDAQIVDTSRVGVDELQPKIIYYQTTPKTERSERKGDIKTLAGSMNHSGGFGAVTFRASDFKNETMVLAGIRGGWIINRTLGIGVEGYGIIPTAKFDNINPASPDLKYVALGGYGGMFLELVLFSNQVIHASFPVSAGAGWLGYNEDWEKDNFNTTQPNPNDTSSELIDEDVFWYVEPGANVEVNIARNFRMAFGVSQRVTQDLSLVSTKAGDFNNTSFYVTLKVGSF
jgi:hypothetical protein